MNCRIGVWTFVMNQGVADHHKRWQHCAHCLTCFDQQACENSNCRMAGLFGQDSCLWYLSTSSMDLNKEYDFWFVTDLKELCKTACMGCACSWWCVSQWRWWDSKWDYDRTQSMGALWHPRIENRVDTIKASWISHSRKIKDHSFFKKLWKSSLGMSMCSFDSMEYGFTVNTELHLKLRNWSQESTIDVQESWQRVWLQGCG